MSDFARKTFRRLQALCSRRGVDVQYVGRVSAEIPDKALYRPHFSPWRDSEWAVRLEADDVTSLVTADRKYVLWNLLLQAARTVEGDIVECGVYRGGTAHMFGKLLRAVSSPKRLHLFDTFAGMPETNSDHDLHCKGDFADTSLSAVRAYLSDARNIEFHEGFIPETFQGLGDLRVCFAHIDLDIYEAIHAATAFLYERMPRGGIIVYDDFGLASCPGARKAVEEYYATKPEVPLVLQTGQCVVLKA